MLQDQSLTTNDTDTQRDCVIGINQAKAGGTSLGLVNDQVSVAVKQTCADYINFNPSAAVMPQFHQVIRFGVGGLKMRDLKMREGRKRMGGKYKTLKRSAKMPRVENSPQSLPFWYK